MKPICVGCMNFFPVSDPMACLAFPDGIPGNILLGLVDHHEPIKGDHGIQFKEA